MTRLAKSSLELIKSILPFHAAAWAASSEPIQRLLDEADGVEKDRLTALWLDTIQTQLNAVGVTVCKYQIP
jgi:hypothetical protein